MNLQCTKLSPDQVVDFLANLAKHRQIKLQKPSSAPSNPSETIVVPTKAAQVTSRAKQPDNKSSKKVSENGQIQGPAKKAKEFKWSEEEQAKFVFMLLLKIDFTFASQILGLQKAQLYTKRQKLYVTLGETFRNFSELLENENTFQDKTKFSFRFRECFKDFTRLQANWVNLLPYLYSDFKSQYQQLVADLNRIASSSPQKIRNKIRANFPSPREAREMINSCVPKFLRAVMEQNPSIEQGQQAINNKLVITCFNQA